MLELDINRIKEYNRELKVYTERSATLRAQLEVAKQDVNKLCAELSEELGVTVTPDNVDSIYKKCVEKINNTLESGEEILRRIKGNGVNGSGKVLDGDEQMPPKMFNI